MPGFTINGTGGGPNALSEVRRTHRWIFQSTTHLRQNVLLVLKSCSRPSLTFEEPAMHHNQEQVYYAGKHTWEPLSMSWYDMEQNPDISQAMYEWLEKCLIVADANVQPPSVFKSTQSSLQMRDGLGNATETWQIYYGWPQALNWGSLDYSSSDLQLIEVKFRFDRAQRA